MPGWQLIQRFSYTSLGLIALIVITLGWVTATSLTQSMLEREKTLTVSYIERVVSGRIPAADLRAAHQLRLESTALRHVAEELTFLPEVVRLKIYDPRGTIIWSDVVDLVGKNFQHDQAVRTSLHGQIVVELEQITSTPEHQFEHPHYRELMSMYVPIRDAATGELLAVFEVYKYPLGLYRLLRQGRFNLWTVAIVGGIVLFLGQFGLVVGAARTINRQYRDVAQHATALEHTNTRLRETQQQLVQAERFAALGEVTAAVAHGIRNPLGNIRLVAQEMREGLGAHDPLRAPLADIMAQVDLLEARMRAFLSTARPFDLILTSTQLDALIDTTVEGMRQQLVEHRVRVDIDTAGEALLVQCDQVKMAEALQILLRNSLEAGAQTITIRTCPLADDRGRRGVQLCLIDNGKGLPAGATERLFQPFYTTKPQGTGLGLVIAKKIIDAHGGHLTLEAHAPHGTRATVWLPDSGDSPKEASA
jgi:signal transduction histidine kinase